MMLGGCASALWNLTPAYGNGFLHPGGARRNEATAKALLRWAAAEREAWLDAVTNDPLLPGRILPSDDWGQQALVAVRKDRRRVESLRDAGRQLRTFHRA